MTGFHNKHVLYTQTEIINLLASKLNTSEISNCYNTAYIDNLISSYYTKNQSDSMFGNKVDLTTFNTANQQRIQVYANLESSKPILAMYIIRAICTPKLKLMLY